MIHARREGKQAEHVLAVWCAAASTCDHDPFLSFAAFAQLASDR